jgi:SAM-dependent methyltransferase
MRTGFSLLCSALGFPLLTLAIMPASAAQPHEAPLPAIDCPLHKAGIDPSKLKPFEEVEKYIEFLERPDRALWQKPDEVVKVLGLKGSEVVADLGAGSGYFSFRLSRAVPQGRVIAIDNQAEMVRHVHRKARTEGFANVIAQVATTEDPQLPHEADLVFVCDVLMHVRDNGNWLKNIHAQMRSGSRLVLIDFKEGPLPEGPPESIKVPKAEILRLCAEAGFKLQADHAGLLPYQQFLVFERP